MDSSRQRIDRWLWHARLVRTRALAAGLAASGHVRVNGQRIGAPSRAVRVGDVLAIALPNTVRVLRVIAFAARRGGSQEAKCLYVDLSPSALPSEPRSVSPDRPPGSGRPTKRERRALARLQRRDSFLDA